MSEKGDIEIYQGAAKTYRFTFTGTNLSGSTIHLHVRKYATDAEPLISLTGGSGLTVTSGTNSTVDATFDDDDIEPGEYVFDIVRVTGTTHEIIYPQRTVTVGLPITRP